MKLIYILSSILATAMAADQVIVTREDGSTSPIGIGCFGTAGPFKQVYTPNNLKVTGYKDYSCKGQAVPAEGAIISSDFRDVLSIKVEEKSKLKHLLRKFFRNHSN